mgnify:CR=1 FL=1
MTYESNSTADTQAIAAAQAARLHPGDCVAALGGDGRAVSSPTFVLLHIYDTPAMKVFHLDAYRVHGSEDFEAIGFAELLEQGGVVIVEWADRVAALLPPGSLRVGIFETGETSRRIEISD